MVRLVDSHAPGRDEEDPMTRLARATLVGVLAVVVAATVGATAASAKPQATPSGTITLAMATTYKPGFDLLISNFNRIYPGITITPAYYVAGAPFTTAVSTQF